MATAKKSTQNKKSLDREKLISLYMDYVLENEKLPGTIYKFCKENKIKEEEFYQFYGSFEALQKGIWQQFFENSQNLMRGSKEYEEFPVREKMLTFFYTFFEILSLNRSYVLYVLRRNEMPLKNLEQLKGLRKNIKSFARELTRESNEEKSGSFFKQSEMLFSEGVWIQFLFLLKFWMDDNSAQFESTDVAIEKSVNTAFDVFDSTPLERVVDFGKFLWKEKMA
ncbi:MAG: TetR family transcriptional regulator C-terminal domain-containing protein [Salegentibacter sp.]